MGDEKDRTPLLPISGVLIFLAALGVTFFAQPFKGTRPAAPEYEGNYAKVNARLWQDPFQAVLDSKALERLTPCELDISSGDPGRIDAECPCFADELGKEDNSVVLGVMVPGGPYAEDSESRMRYRYAVLSGLGRLGYVPQDAEHVQFIKVLSSGRKEDQCTLANIMPLEQLGRAGGGAGRRVLIAWMNESVFEKEPLARIKRLAMYLGPFIKPANNNFKVIGPALSDTLRVMVQEAKDPPMDQREEARRDGLYEIYSAMATVDDRTLLKDAECGPSPDSDGCRLVKALPGDAEMRVKEIFETRGYDFIRIIKSDRRLAGALIDELKLRGVDPMGEETQILIVAEWDTYYGQSFKEYFEEEIDRAASRSLREKGVPEAKLEERLKDIEKRVRRISYLRGIDGSIPGRDGRKDRKEDERRDEKDEAKGNTLKDRKKLEQAVGPSQYDYLRRLSEEIGRFNAYLRRDGKKEIKAVGVVGTDFYDKYLVLQALRRTLPDVVYFTTDMDARFLHPDHIEWTRNLVIASNFALSLRKDLEWDIQGQVPPFRDSYQTSVFLAVLKAFGGGVRPQGAARYDKQQPPKESPGDLTVPEEPLVFEVGNRTAVLLSHPKEDIHPRTALPYRPVRNEFTRVTRLILFAFMLLSLISPGFQGYVKWLIHGPAGWLGVTARFGPILLLIFAAAAIYRISGMADEEPFSILEGISVWPTLILRIIAIVLSWVFFCLACNTRRGNALQTARKFHFGEDALDGTTWRTVLDDLKSLTLRRTWRWKNIRKWFSDTMYLGREPEEIKRWLGWKPDSKNHLLRDLWREYVTLDSARNRFWRVAIIAALYFVFSIIMVGFDSPVSPLRGKMSRSADKIVMFCCLSSFIILVTYVFDVTARCRMFISIASEAFREKSFPESDQEMRDRIREGLDLIHLIADRGAVIGKFIFYPFIVWLVIFVSRTTLFDNWRTPVSLAVMIFLGAVYAWASALLLRFQAEKARTTVIGALEKLPGPSAVGRSYTRPIRDAIEEIRAIRDGAFARLSQHPVLQVLFLPFGGLGGVFGIELLSKLNL